MAADEAAAVEILVVLHDFLVEHQEAQASPEQLEYERDLPHTMSEAYHEQQSPSHAVPSPGWDYPPLNQSVQGNPLPWQAHQQLSPWQPWAPNSSSFVSPDGWAAYQPAWNDQSWEQDDGHHLGPSLEYDKQPRPTSWQPNVDTDCGGAASKKYWKLGKLGRGPESDADKVCLMEWPPLPHGQAWP